jgi:hypothetical protein
MLKNIPSGLGTHQRPYNRNPQMIGNEKQLGEDALDFTHLKATVASLQQIILDRPTEPKDEAQGRN